MPLGANGETPYNGKVTSGITPMLKRIHSLKKSVGGRMHRLLDAIETAPLDLSTFALTFFSIIIFRIFIEYLLAETHRVSLEVLFFTFSHYLLEFFTTSLILIPILILSGAKSTSRAINLIVFGLLIILTPPIIDVIIMGSGITFSLYEFGNLQRLLFLFLNFFDDSPWNGITYGIRFEIAVVSIGIGIYAFFRLKRFIPAILSSFLCYSVFFIISTIPSWITILILSPKKGIFNVTENDALGMFLSPERFFSNEVVGFTSAIHVKMSIVYAILSTAAVGALLYHLSKRTFLALLKNARMPQMIWHGGLLFLGGGLAMIYAGARPDFDFFEILSIILLVVAVESAWLASVIGNDIADRRIDEKTNAMRPLPTGDIPTGLYAEIGVLFFFFSILFSAIVSWKATLLVLAYQGLAWIYSMPPLRLKRFPVIATMLAALAGMTVLLIGFSTLAPGSGIDSIPMSLLAFLFIAYAATLPLKDFKDIEGDTADGVLTIPVLFGAERARLIIGSALFIVYMASPVVLHESALIVPAILFGSLSFWSIVRSERVKKSWGTFRTLPGWNMLFITLYGIFVALILL